MVKRSTWVMVVALALIAALAYYIQTVPNNFIQKALTAGKTPTVGASLGTLISATDGPLNGISVISTDGHRVDIKRETTGDWSLSVDGKSVPADQTGADQVSSQAQVLRLTADNIKPATSDLSAFGLDKPAYTYQLVLSNGKTVAFKVGKATVTGNGYYLQKEDGTIVAVDKYVMDTLLDLLKQPPYKVSPTPSPAPATELPTGTITPPPAATLTVTPTPGT